ncbi:hypothetical protein FQN55_007108 [Onygenales sp. PD_40]|nr:hypothetical protein FQN55_007108 [Onygenales sp. PD_40]
MKCSTISELLALALSLRLVSANSWTLQGMKSLVAFGDSYTDESRLGYFIEHQEAPPVGWIGPESNSTASGGQSWARYVSQYTDSELYNYAVSGAVCSNDVTPRYFESIDAPFPAVEQYEIPAFIADSEYEDPDSGEPALCLPPQHTVYSMWIGTNDLGNDAFMTDSQIEGKSVLDYIECVLQGFDSLFENGARYFVLMNVAPLHLLPQYSTPERGGVNATQFWPNKPENITEISYRMQQTVVTVNEILALKVQLAMKDRYQGANVAIFDTSKLLSDIYSNPNEYLNGTEPANVEGWNNQCDLEGNNCVPSSSPDSFMWYDALHPSEQTSRIIAEHFVEVIEGESDYATYFD